MSSGDLVLEPREYQVYLRLKGYAVDGVCTVSTESLASACGMSMTAIRGVKKVLEGKGLIVVEKVSGCMDVVRVLDCPLPGNR